MHNYFIYVKEQLQFALILNYISITWTLVYSLNIPDIFLPMHILRIGIITRSRVLRKPKRDNPKIFCKSEKY